MLYWIWKNSILNPIVKQGSHVESYEEIMLDTFIEREQT